MKLNNTYIISAYGSIAYGHLFTLPSSLQFVIENNSRPFVQIGSIQLQGNQRDWIHCRRYLNKVTAALENSGRCNYHDVHKFPCTDVMKST